MNLHMRKLYVFALLLFVATTSGAQLKGISTFLNVHAGYGTETNIGYYGLLGGAGLEKSWKRKIALEVAVSYFAGGGDLTYTNASESYKALFYRSGVGYRLIGTNQSFFRMMLSAGSALKKYRAKMLGQNYSYFNPDGTETIREPVKYEIEKGLSLSLYSGLDFTFKITPKVKAGLFLDTYSHEILLEHFMPGVKASVRL